MSMESVSSHHQLPPAMFLPTALYGHGQPGHRLWRRPLSSWFSPAAPWQQMQPFGPTYPASSRCFMVLPATSSARVVRWLTFLVDVREAWMVQAAASYTPYDLSSSGMVMAEGDPPEWMAHAGMERPMLAPQPALGHAFAAELRETRIHTPGGSLHLIQRLLHHLGPIALLPRLQSPPGDDSQYIPPPTDTSHHQRALDVESLVGAPLQYQRASDELNAPYILVEYSPHRE